MDFKKSIRNNVLTNFLYEFGIVYPSPSNLNYFWNFGFLALMFLVFQIITGVILAMFYTPHIDLAFLSVERIMRDVNYGYLIRYFHANGASAFFLIVYIHILKGLYYGSFTFPRRVLWITGVIILLLMIIIAFMGYVLIWGQMSFWAATVITNLFSVIPYFGDNFVLWLWGGFSVDNATLNRFFSLHFALPFVLLGFVIFHLLCLHNWGSNNPLGFHLKIDHFSFTPFFFVKDFMFFFFFLFLFFLFLFFYPNFFGHTDNYIEANPLVTPIHIVPEWYFLPFYAILRALPNKVMGVIFFVLSVVILFLFPFFSNLLFRSSYFKPFFQVFFYIFVLVVLSLGWVGGKPVEPIYYFLSQILTFFYFFYFFVILILFSKFDVFLLEFNLFYYLNKN